MKLPISKFTVIGNSMFPALKDGADILSFNWAYIGRKPNVGEVIVLNFNGRDMVKRVTKVQEELIFVEGDNKQESTDSRDFGAIGLNQVIGKVIYGPSEIDCPRCASPVIGIYGGKDAICNNCGFKLSCCGES